MYFLTIIFFFHISYFTFIVDTHPQCLNFEPPFIPTKQLRFCSFYRGYSCCTKDEDENLSEKYQNIFDKFHLANFRDCSRYVRDILCAKCDPFAAHVFQAETDPENPFQFPGLCHSYCENFYITCRETLPYLTNDTRLSGSKNADEFCRLLALKDADYCYPDILSKNNATAGIRTADENCICVKLEVGGLRNPVYGTFAADRTNRFYILEQVGLINIYADNWQRLPKAFLDIRDRVYVTNRQADERGLLGLAFHPNFARNRIFYVYYVANITAIDNDKATPLTAVRISRFQASADGMTGDAKSERVMIELPKPNNWANHNGGMLMFGLDGMLYAFIGDGGGGGDLYNNAQNMSVLFGKAIRLDVNLPNEQNPYKIPENNPFVKDVHAKPEIFAYGLRNAWRCAADRGDSVTGQHRGRIICGDVGQDGFEEIDIIESGKNYGWRAKEGFVCYNEKQCKNTVNDTLPIHAYSHKEGKSVTGGYIYRGCQNPNLKGAYIYGDFTNGQLFALKQSNENTWKNQKLNLCEKRLCTNGLLNECDRNILSFAEDYKGEIYILSTNFASSDNREGKLYRIIDPLRKEDPTSCKYPKPVS